jgi:uncharacterized protein (TIGR02118 family)
MIDPPDTGDMYKHAALLVRKEGMSHEAFVDHWQNEHVPIASEIPGVVRYSTVLPVDPEAAEFDGIAELYFEDLDALRASLGEEGTRDYDPDDPTARAAREDVDNFLAVEDRPRLIGEETVQKDEMGGETTGLYKHSAFLVRQEGMTHDEFVDHWQNEHVPIASEIPGVVRYATVLPVDPEAAEFDGIAELYFEDLGALRAALGQEGTRDYDPDDPKSKPAREDAGEQSSPSPRSQAREDVDNFLALEDRPRLIGEETVQKNETAE